jgi:hypothetical protein
VSTEDEFDEVKDSFCKELEGVFGKFPKCHVTILLRSFNAKIHLNYLNPAIGNENLHEINNNIIRVVKFDTHKKVSTIKSTIFPHHNIPGFS